MKDFNTINSILPCSVDWPQGWAYHPLDIVMVRVPLLSVRSYQQITSATLASAVGAFPSAPGRTSDADSASSLVIDDRVRLALMIGSRSLSESLVRGSRSGRRDERVLSKLLRYLIRMSTRPTPYGIYASVGLAKFGERTDVKVTHRLPRRRTRPDMAWLINFVASQESRPEVREQLLVFTNSAMYMRGDRYVIGERFSLRQAETQPEVSIRATERVRQTLERAREAISYAELCDYLLRTTGATSEKVNGLLNSLIDQSFLLTELRPCLTDPEPARSALRVLKSVDACREAAANLEVILTESVRCDELEPVLAIEEYRSLHVRAEKLVPCVEGENPFQVDASLPLQEATVSRLVGREAVHLAEVLLRISPHPDGLPSMTAYREKFVTKYEFDREVPLLEMLDPNLGIGPYPTESARSLVQRPSLLVRQRALLEIASTAQRNLQTHIELDELMLARLKADPVTQERLPSSIDVCFYVSAASQSQIDEENFRLVLSPGGGAMGAGRMLGRFAHLLGEDANRFLRHYSRLEDALFPHAISADLAYMPKRARTANVCICACTRKHQVSIGQLPKEGITDIPLRELVVGVRNNRFYLRWTRVDKLVRIFSGHVLNPALSPTVSRFLSDLE